MDLIVDGRIGEEDARHPADHEERDEPDRVDHRHGHADAAPEHGQDPVVDLHPRRDADQHGGDAEGGVDPRALPHGEEVVKPDGEGEHRDAHGRQDQRSVAVEAFAREGGDHLGIDPEGGQDEDVDLGMAEQPEEVGVHHHVAARLRGEEVEARIAVQRQHQRGGRERRHGEDHQDRDAQRRPAEERHAEGRHAGAALLVEGHGEVHAGERGAEARQRHRPDPVIRPRIGAEPRPGEGRIARPAAI